MMSRRGGRLVSVSLLGGILAHDMCCFFDGPRGAGAAQSSSRSPLRRARIAAAAVSPKCNKERVLRWAMLRRAWPREMVWSACTSLEVGGASLRGRSTPGQMTDVAQHSSEMVSSACSQAAASLLDASACLLSLWEAETAQFWWCSSMFGPGMR